MSIFKACDIRGVYPDELNEATYADLGRAIGTLLRERTPTPHVVVAGDVRPSTPLLRAALIDGLVATGCSVADLGIVPTPVAYFAYSHGHFAAKAAQSGAFLESSASPSPLAERGSGGEAAWRSCFDALAIVTASHNPPKYNGLKVCLGPMPITEEEMARVESTLAARRFASGPGGVRAVSVEEDYIAFLCGDAKPGDGFRIVLDCGNGSYSDLAPRVLRRLGYDVVELFCTSDGTFPNRSPNPSLPENLGALRRAVQESGAAVGLALDGDGDRLAIVDGLGRSLTGDQAIILLARHILQARPYALRGDASSAAPRPPFPLPPGEGRVRGIGNDECRMPNAEWQETSPHSSFGIDSSFVIRQSSFPSSPAPRPSSPTPEGEGVVLDIKCSQAVPDAVRACGGTPLLERSGHTFIKTRMIADRALFGGELSGHFFYRQLAGGDDGLYSVLRVAELARESDVPISKIVDAMPHYATTPDIRVPYAASDGAARLEEIAAAATGEVLRLDGVRIAYPDGWGLVRCSVTEPLWTFRFEAFEGSPRRIAERFLAATPDLLARVLGRLGR